MQKFTSKKGFTLSTRNAKAFTLVELLIVIVIIGILAGIVLAIINPAEMRKKANVSVARANLDKVCLAMNACGVTVSDAALCNTFDEIGVSSAQIVGVITDNVPANFTYTISDDGAGLITSSVSGTGATVGGAATTCSLSCTMNVTTGTSTPIVAATAANCFNL